MSSSVFVALVVLSVIAQNVALVGAFPIHKRNSFKNFVEFDARIVKGATKVVSQSKSKLFLDIFGLGPTEVVIILGAAALLYGPDRIKGQLRESGVKGVIVSAGWRAEREERIKELSQKAESVRKKRALQFLEEAVTNENLEVIELVDQFNNLYSEKS
mmetsp:Transcript_21477/g.30778  ORF Transcript_21477/g.30778 Transcript_21477/m.30778 type:complete len:158 (-) Transcript_21477:65-538(-)